MNVIIVGANGRPSILDMIQTYPFKSEVIVLTYKRNRKTGGTFWTRINSSDKGKKQLRLSTAPTFTHEDKIIMWGTRIQINLNGAMVFNSPANANNASNKKIAREIFEKENIAAPKLIHNNELHTASYPLIIRKDRHRAGIGFNIVNNDIEALKIIKGMNEGEYYMSEIYPKTEEYRVHCGSGKALLVKRKPEPNDKSIVAWNFHQNELPWTTIERKNYDHEMVSLALRAVDAVGLDFGAVDVMSHPIKGYNGPKHVVVEINTAPSYTPYLIEKYGAYFDLLFSTKDKFDKWDHSKFTKGTSLAWKNKQLNL